jgi:uncharacterized membrane protein YqaE (UPF0057 family)
MNILFPPLAVFMLTGLNEDVIFNCVLFLLAVIPSHIHGFYISLTYFQRKRKVRKGVYPGKPHRMIWSQKVNNGGASRSEMQEMLEEKEGRALSQRISRRLTNRVRTWDDGNSEKFAHSPDSPLSRRSTKSRRSRRYDEDDFDRGRLSQRSSHRALSRNLSSKAI